MITKPSFVSRRFFFAAPGLVAALTMMASSTFAATPEEEINHLIAFVKASNVEFIRSGKAHGSDEAIKHIKAKRDHFSKKIKSAEDFIAYSATKSLISGKAYQVRTPDGKVHLCADWLTAELGRYRAGNPTPIN